MNPLIILEHVISPLIYVIWNVGMIIDIVSILQPTQPIRVGLEGTGELSRHPAIYRLACILICSQHSTEQDQSSHRVAMMQPIDQKVIVSQGPSTTY
jgi:hypothetical protein